MQLFKSKEDVPILIIFFNRKDCLSVLFDNLRILKPKKIYLAADGPRKNVKDDECKCKEAREFAIKSIDWECKIEVNYSELNYGCGLGPKRAIDWFFINEEAGIILEDDCIPNSTFFDFCFVNLNNFANNSKMFLVSGNNFFPHLFTDNSSSFVSSFSFTWGWATWRRAWNKYSYEIHDYSTLKFYKKFKSNLGLSLSSFLFWDYLFISSIKKKFKSHWDYQWAYTVMINDGLSINPIKNLVTNIGGGHEATHFSNYDWPIGMESEDYEVLQENMDFKRNWEYDDLAQVKIYGKLHFFKYLVRRLLNLFQ